MMATSKRRPERRGYELELYQTHLQSVKSMKPSIDNKPPTTLKTSHTGTARSEIEKRRKYAAIEYDNKLLLERLAKIVSRKEAVNKVHESVEVQQNLMKKLSMTKKKLEMQRITEENMRLLKRIQETSPAYNHLEWEEEARQREGLKRGMALYPEYYDRQEKGKSDVMKQKSTLSPLKSSPSRASMKGGRGIVSPS